MVGGLAKVLGFDKLLKKQTFFLLDSNVTLL